MDQQPPQDNKNIRIQPFPVPKNPARPDQFATPEDYARAQDLYYKSLAHEEVFGGKDPTHAALRLPEHNQALREGRLSQESLMRVAGQSEKARQQGKNNSDAERQLRALASPQKDQHSSWSLVPQPQDRQTKQEYLQKLSASQSEITKWYEETAKNASRLAGKTISVAQIRKFVPNLSHEQLAIIRSKSATTITTAGAGSGKSTVIIAQMIDDIVNRGQDPKNYNISTMSRTHAGVNALTSRLDQIQDIIPNLPKQMVSSNAHTLDSKALSLLNKGKSEGNAAIQKLYEGKIANYQPLTGGQGGKQRTIEDDVEARTKAMHSHLSQVMEQVGISQKVNPVGPLAAYIGETKGNRYNGEYDRRMAQGKQHFEAGKWKEEQQGKELPPELIMYAYEQSLKGRQGFRLPQQQSPLYDQHDAPFLVTEAVKQGHIAPIKRAIFDEFQDMTPNQARMAAALTSGSQSRAFYGGDMGQPALAQKERIDLQLKQAYGERASSHQLTGNYRSGEHIVSPLNTINALSVLEGKGQSPMQIAMGKSEGLPASMTMEGNHQQLYTTMANDWMKLMQTSPRKIKEAMEREESPFQDAPILAQEAPLVFQMNDLGRGKFRDTLRETLTNSIGEEHTQKFFEQHYSEEPFRAENADKMHALTIAQIRSREAPHVFFDATRAGKWDDEGYAHNLYTASSRATEQNHFYASQTNIIGSAYDLTPTNFLGQMVPPGFDTILRGTAEDLTQVQGMAPAQLPPLFQDALRLTPQMYQQPHQQGPQEDPQALARYIEDVIMLGKHYQAPIGSGTGIQKQKYLDGIYIGDGNNSGSTLHSTKGLSAAIIAGQYKKNGDQYGADLMRRQAQVLVQNGTRHQQPTAGQRLFLPRRRGNAPAWWSPSPRTQQTQPYQYRNPQNAIAAQFPSLPPIEGITWKQKEGARENVPDWHEFMKQTKSMIGPVHPAMDDVDFTKEGKMIRTPFNPESMHAAPTVFEDHDNEKKEFAPREDHSYIGRDIKAVKAGMNTFVSHPGVSQHPRIQSMLKAQMTHPDMIERVQTIADTSAFHNPVMKRISHLLPFTQSPISAQGVYKSDLQLAQQQSFGVPTKEQQDHITHLERMVTFAGTPIADYQKKLATLRTHAQGVPTKEQMPAINQLEKIVKTKQMLQGEKGEAGVERIMKRIQDPSDKKLYHEELARAIRTKAAFLLSQHPDHETLTQLITVANQLGQSHSDPGIRETFRRYSDLFQTHLSKSQDVENGLTVDEGTLAALTKRDPRQGHFLNELLRDPKTRELRQLDHPEVHAALEKYPYKEGVFNRTIAKMGKDVGISQQESDNQPALTAIRAYAQSLEKTGVVDPQAVEAHPLEADSLETGKNADFAFHQFGAGAPASGLQQRYTDILGRRGDRLEPQARQDMLAQLGQLHQARTALHNPVNQQRWAHTLGIVQRATTGESVSGKPGEKDPIRDLMGNRTNDYKEGSRTLESLTSFVKVLEQASSHIERTGELKRSHLMQVLQTLGHSPDDKRFTGLRRLEASHNFAPTEQNPDPSLPLQKLIGQFPKQRDIVNRELTRVPLRQGMTYEFKGGEKGYGPLTKSQLAFNKEAQEKQTPLITSGMQGSLHPFVGEDGKENAFGHSNWLATHRGMAMFSQEQYDAQKHLPGSQGHLPILNFEGSNGIRFPVTPEQLSLVQPSYQLPEEDRYQENARRERAFQPVALIQQSSHELGWPSEFREENAHLERENTTVGFPTSDARPNMSQIIHPDTIHNTKAIRAYHQESLAMQQDQAQRREQEPKPYDFQWDTSLPFPPRPPFNELSMYPESSSTLPGRLSYAQGAPERAGLPVRATPTAMQPVAGRFQDVLLPDHATTDLLMAHAPAFPLRGGASGGMVPYRAGSSPRLQPQTIVTELPQQPIRGLPFPSVPNRGMTPSMTRPPQLRAQTIVTELPQGQQDIKGLPFSSSPLQLSMSRRFTHRDPNLPAQFNQRDPRSGAQIAGWNPKLLKSPTDFTLVGDPRPTRESTLELPPTIRMHGPRIAGLLAGQAQSLHLRPGQERYPIRGFPAPLQIAQHATRSTGFTMVHEPLPPRAPLATPDVIRQAGPRIAGYLPQRAQLRGSALNEHYLSREQRNVITDDAQHMIIRGGPGSGKTSTAVDRMKEMILSGKIQPQNVTALSATHSGVEALNEKFQKQVHPFLPKRNDAAFSLRNARTIHGLANDVVFGNKDEEGNYPFLEGIGKGHIKGMLADVSEADQAHMNPQERGILRHTDQKKFLQQALQKRFQPGAKIPQEGELKKMMDEIGKIQKSQGVNDQHYQDALTQGRKDLSQNQVTNEAGLLAYEEAKEQAGLADFNDTPVLATKILDRYGLNAVPQRMQGTQMIMNDEAQDTTPAALRMMASLANVTGARTQASMDPMQGLMEGLGSIAPGEVIGAYQDAFKQSGQSQSNHELTTNFRSDDTTRALNNAFLLSPTMAKEAGKGSPQVAGPNTKRGNPEKYTLTKSDVALYQKMYRSMVASTGVPHETMKKNVEAGEHPFAGVDFKQPGLTLPKQIPGIFTINNRLDFFKHVAAQTMAKDMGVSHGLAQKAIHAMTRRGVPGVEQGPEINKAARTQFPLATPIQIKGLEFEQPHVDATRAGAYSNRNQDVAYTRNMNVALSRTKAGGQNHVFSSNRPFGSWQQKQYMQGQPFVESMPDNPLAGTVELGSGHNRLVLPNKSGVNNPVMVEGQLVPNDLFGGVIPIRNQQLAQIAPPAPTPIPASPPPVSTPSPVGASPSPIPTPSLPVPASTPSPVAPTPSMTPSPVTPPSPSPAAPAPKMTLQKRFEENEWKSYVAHVNDPEKPTVEGWKAHLETQLKDVHADLKDNPGDTHALREKGKYEAALRDPYTSAFPVARQAPMPSSTPIQKRGTLATPAPITPAPVAVAPPPTPIQSAPSQRISPIAAAALKNFHVSLGEAYQKNPGGGSWPDFLKKAQDFNQQNPDKNPLVQQRRMDTLSAMIKDPQKYHPDNNTIPTPVVTPSPAPSSSPSPSPASPFTASTGNIPNRANTPPPTGYTPSSSAQGAPSPHAIHITVPPGGSVNIGGTNPKINLGGANPLGPDPLAQRPGNRSLSVVPPSQQNGSAPATRTSGSQPTQTIVIPPIKSSGGGGSGGNKKKPPTDKESGDSGKMNFNNPLANTGRSLARIGSEMQFIGKLFDDITTQAAQQGSEYRRATGTLQGSGKDSTSGFFDFTNGGAIDSFQGKNLPMYSKVQIAQGMHNYAASQGTQNGLLGGTQSALSLSALSGVDPSQLMGSLSSISGTLGQGANFNTNNQVSGMLSSMYGGNLSALNVTPTLQSLQSILPTMQGLSLGGGSQLSSTMATFQAALSGGMTPQNLGDVSSALGGLSGIGSTPDLQGQAFLSKLFPKKQMTANTQYVEYQNQQVQQGQQLQQLQLQQNIGGGLSLPRLQMQIANADIQMEKANLDMGSLQLANSQASFAFNLKQQDAEYGAIGADTSRNSYFSFMRNQQAAGYNPLSAETGTQFVKAPTAGLKNMEFYAGVEHSRQDMVLSRSPLLSDAKFQENMKYLNEQEAFYQQELALTNAQRTFDQTWTAKMLGQQATQLALQQKNFTLDVQRNAYEQQNLALQDKFLPQQVTAIQNLMAAQKQFMSGQGPVAGKNVTPAEILQALAAIKDPKQLQQTLAASRLPLDQQNTIYQIVQAMQKPGGSLAAQAQKQATSDAPLLATLQKLIGNGAFTDQKAVASMADAMLNFAGKGGSWDQFVKAFDDADKTWKDIGQELSGLAPFMKKMGTLLDILGPVLVGIGALLNTLGLLQTLLQGLAKFFKIPVGGGGAAAGGGGAAVAGVVGGAALAIGAGVVGWNMYSKKQEDAPMSWNKLGHYTIPNLVGDSLNPGYAVGQSAHEFWDLAHGNGTKRDKEGLKYWQGVGSNIKSGVQGFGKNIGNWWNDINKPKQASDPKKNLNWYEPGPGQHTTPHGGGPMAVLNSFPQKKQGPDWTTQASNYFTKTLPNWWDTIPGGFFTKTLPNFFTTTVGGFFTKTVGGFFTGTVGPFFTKTLPNFFGSTVGAFFSTTLPNFLGGTIGVFFRTTLPNFFGGTVGVFFSTMLPNFLGSTIGVFFSKTFPNFLGSTVGVFFSTILPNFFTATVSPFFNKTLPNFFITTVGGFFTKTLPDLFSTTVGTYFTKTLPDWWNTNVGSFFTKTLPDFFTKTLPGLLTKALGGISLFGGSGSSGGGGMSPTSGAPAGFSTPNVNTEFGTKMWYGQHQGIDFNAAEGTPLSEFVGGTVTNTGFFPWGGEVDVAIGGGLTERYLHLSKIDVKNGQGVGRGTHLGLTGGGTAASGLGFWSHGSHSHVQVDRGNMNAGINPWPIWALKGARDISANYGGGGHGGGAGGAERTHLALGGIVTQRANVQLGELGPEAVVPLTQLSSVLHSLPLAQQAGASTSTHTTTHTGATIGNLVGALHINVGSGGKMNETEQDELMSQLMDILTEAAKQISGKLT